MKKILSLILALAMVLSLAACGASEAPDPVPTDPAQNAATDTADTTDTTPTDSTPATVNPVELLFYPATSPATGAYATIKISADVKLDDESAWLGLCPTGKDYITEAEADDVDVIWFNPDAREDGDPAVFACDFESVEDGTYAVVVATSDDENVGYIVIQLEMTKNGDSISFDYSNAKLNERPAN